MTTILSSVQTAGRVETWKPDMVYIGMPGKAARAFGIADSMVGPYGKPWELLDDERGWAIAYREYLWSRLNSDPEFRTAVRNLDGMTLLCWCSTKVAGTRRKDGSIRTEDAVCHGQTLQRAIAWLVGEGEEPSPPTDPITSFIQGA